MSAPVSVPKYAHMRRKCLVITPARIDKISSMIPQKKTVSISNTINLAREKNSGIHSNLIRICRQNKVCSSPLQSLVSVYQSMPQPRPQTKRWTLNRAENGAKILVIHFRVTKNLKIAQLNVQAGMKLVQILSNKKSQKLMTQVSDHAQKLA